MEIFSLTINRATNSFADKVVTIDEPSLSSQTYSAKPDISRKATKPASGDLNIRVLQNIQDMQAFESQWRKLEETGAKPSNVFQSYDWCYNWAQTCTIDNDCYSINIVTVSRNDECLLIWPMMTTCVGPICVLRWLSDPYSQYGDVLVADTPEKDELLELAWHELKTLPGIDSIRLRHVRHDANVHSFLARNTKNDGTCDHAPFLEIDKFPTQTAYDTRYTKSQRRRRKRIRTSLAKNGEIIFSHANKGEQFDHSLDRAITEKRQWLNERGLHSKPVQGDELGGFFHALAENGKTLKPLASQLNSGEQEVSYEIGLRYKNYHFGYLTAHDNSLTDASPARLHMDMSQRLAIDDGMKAFDLMVPADPHKKTWSSASVETADYFIPTNTKGAIYTMAYLQILRPLVRTIYKTVSPKIRRHITRWI